MFRSRQGVGLTHLPVEEIPGADGGAGIVFFCFCFTKLKNEWISLQRKVRRSWVRTAPVMSHGVVCWFGVGDCAVGVFMCE